MAAYHPWRDLRSRPHIVLAFDTLAAQTGGGAYGRIGDFAAIMLDPELPQRERAAALTHELCHEDLGVAPPGLDRTVARRHERRIDAEVARRLVPLDELQQLLERLADALGGVTARDIADHFDVPDEVASRAARLLGQLGGPE